MQDHLFGTYQVMGVALYLFLSSVLLYHRLILRWMKFCLCFFIFYLIGSLLFFSKSPFPFLTRDLLAALPYILLYVGSPLLLGYCLLRQFSFLETAGSLLIFCAVTVSMMIAYTNFYGTSWGFFYELQPHTKAWIEIASIVLLFSGLFSVGGYARLCDLEHSQRVGAVLIFLAVMGAVIGGVHFTIGYQYIWTSIGFESPPFSR